MEFSDQKDKQKEKKTSKKCLPRLHVLQSPLLLGFREHLLFARESQMALGFWLLLSRAFI